ncbi:hypothetical protein TNCT_440731, partial [Trichonephila clavata]
WPLIAKKDTNYRDSIQSKDRLALTLRHLATGDFMASLSYSFRIGRSTTSSIIREYQFLTKANCLSKAR